MNCNYIRIAVSETELPKRFIYNMGIARPDRAVYKDYSVLRPKSRGGLGRYGYPNVEIYWRNMLQKDAFILRNLIEGALDLTNGIIYVTVDTANGQSPGKHWVDFYGIPQMPVFEEAGDGLPVTYFEDVSLIINNLKVLNDPATGI